MSRAWQLDGKAFIEARNRVQSESGSVGEDDEAFEKEKVLDPFEQMVAAKKLSGATAARLKKKQASKKEKVVEIKQEEKKVDSLVGLLGAKRVAKKLTEKHEEKKFEKRKAGVLGSGAF